MYCSLETQEVQVKQVYIIFPWITIYWHFDLKAACLNMTVYIQLHLKNMYAIQVFCFLKYIT